MSIFFGILVPIASYGLQIDQSQGENRLSHIIIIIIVVFVAIVIFFVVVVDIYCHCHCYCRRFYVIRRNAILKATTYK